MGTLFGYMLGLGDGEHRAQLERERAQAERQRAREAEAQNEEHMRELAMVAALRIRKLTEQRDAYRERFLEERAMRRSYQRFTLAAKEIFVEHGLMKDTSDEAAEPLVRPVMKRSAKEHNEDLDLADKEVDEAHPVEE
jgi:hypothetical protein